MRITWEWHMIKDGEDVKVEDDEYESESELEMLYYIAGITSDIGGLLFVKNLEVYR